VASRSTREPTSYRDVFTILADEDLVDVDVAEEMAEMAGFRNVLAHDYAGIDHDRVHAHLQDLERFRRFAEAIHGSITADDGSADR
jgi:uncharacterized protein YutE (UPF0331/DUF86 family)